jgi:molybdenum cofactor biosynthesis enzyme MoaA
VSDPDAPPLDSQTLVETLERHGVAYVAVGGIAAQWQGASRPTLDMDICPAWDDENLERLARAMRDLDARLKVPEARARVSR